ncbi:hypothetical protein BKI52_43240 [marine bacterium AO1-C]|nr:hypothetical protein BKI52_43240 [marine bacterium AO1-C]
MNTKTFSLIVALFFAGTVAFAQGKKLTDEQYKQMMNFELNGKTWVYHQEFDQNGKTPKHRSFFDDQKMVLKLKGKPLKALLITEEERKTLKQERRLAPPTHWLRYDILSCGFLSRKGIIHKANANTLVLDYNSYGKNYQVIFKAKN